MIDWKDYANFTEKEFRCRGENCCGGRADMDPAFMRHLQAMRTEAAFPFIITSGFRCPEYNMKVSTTGPNGPHTTGHAADIGVYRARAHKVAGLAYWHGMTGIGLKQKGALVGRFIHADDLKTGPRPNTWTY